MQEFFKFGLTFKRLDLEHLEMVRQWRNSDYVRSQMLYNEYITPEMQKKWFDQLDKNTNYYFIVYNNSEAVGVMQIKNIENNRGEGGIFLTNQKYENSDVVARMILCFNDLIFYELKIKCIYSQVKITNKKALSSSISQGCIRNEEKSTNEIVYFELFPENYEKKVLKIKKILK